MTTQITRVRTTKVMRWGGGLGIKVPVALVRSLSLSEGRLVGIFREGRRLVIEPQPVLPTLEQLLAEVTQSRVPEEAEWRRPGPMGRREAP